MHPEKTSPALLSLALLTFTSLPSVLILPPLLLLLMFSPVSALANPTNPKINWSQTLYLTLEFGAYLSILAILSSLVAGSSSWVMRTWGAVYVPCPSCSTLISCSRCFYQCHAPRSYPKSWNLVVFLYGDVRPFRTVLPCCIFSQYSTWLSAPRFLKQIIRLRCTY